MLQVCYPILGLRTSCFPYSILLPLPAPSLSFFSGCLFCTYSIVKYYAILQKKIYFSWFPGSGHLGLPFPASFRLPTPSLPGSRPLNKYAPLNAPHPPPLLMSIKSQSQCYMYLYSMTIILIAIFSFRPAYDGKNYGVVTSKNVDSKS